MDNPWIKPTCETCGAEAYAASAKGYSDICESCYEVESRLDAYLSFENGFLKVVEAIKAKGLADKAFGPLLVEAIVSGLKR